MIDKSCGEGTYKKLSKKTKININSSVTEVTHMLRSTYSFKCIQSPLYTSGQPEFPKKDWIRNAIGKLVEIGDATWTNKPQGDFCYTLTSKEINVLDYYIEKCIEENVTQMDLFSQ